MMVLPPGCRAQSKSEADVSWRFESSGTERRSLVKMGGTEEAANSGTLGVKTTFHPD